MPKKSKAPPLPPPMETYLAKEDSLNDLLKDIHHDTASPQNQKVQITQKRLRDTMPTDEIEVEDDENLGENFEQTPWVPPSINKAKEFRRKSIYRGGDARIDSIEIVKVSDLGAGVTLYFQFALSMAVCLFIMSVLSLPALVFAYNGESMAIDEQDSFGLYRYTLGNIGYDAETKSGNSTSSCTDCVRIGSRVIPMTQAASLLTAMEFLQIVVFFIGVFHLYRTALSVTGRNSKAETSVTNYAVMVTDLPPDVTDTDLVDHFSSLYRLDGRDFRNRPGVEGAEPVAELVNSQGNELLLGTWVAECVLHKGIGAFISDFKNKAHVMEKMYRARATMKMYAENSPHKDGHNLLLFKQAEKVVHATGALIDEITQKNLQRAGMSILTKETRNGDVESGDNTGAVSVVKRSVSDPNSIYYNIDAAPVAAFVVFEHCESFARCIRDHAQYAHYPMRWFYPNVLKIHGHKVNVVRASEPDQILWENLEVTKRQKSYLRIRTSLITFLLVIGCFIVVLQASIYKAYFSARVPDNDVCDATVPLLYSNNSRGITLSDMKLKRPSSSLQSSLDAQCVSVTGSKDAFFAVYTAHSGGEVDTDAAPGYSDDIYDFSACTLDATLDRFNSSSGSRIGGRLDALCPEPRRARYCPCVSTLDKSTCYSRDCYFDKESSSCDTFAARSIGACFCYQELADLVSGGGVMETLNKLNALKDGPCGNFYGQYSLSVGLTYVSVLVTTIVNVLLRWFLKKLAKHEARSNTDEEQGSVMTKIFLSNYATMAIIILVAYGKAHPLPTVLQKLHIFNGVYDDFSPGWYGQVGYFLVTTSILQSFSPLVANLFLYYVGKPLLRWYHHSRVKALKSHSIVMQHDLNMLEVGPVFDSTDHTAQLLTLLFFSMTFAPGLPLLMPLCCFTFVLYFRVDKLLLCRYYQTPPHVGDATIRLVVLLLPLAAVVRLGFACWMFSCRDTAFGREASAQTASVSSAYAAFLETARSNSATSVVKFANDRIFQPHTFPLFVLLLFCATSFILAQIYREIPLHLLFSRLLDCFNSLSKDGHASADARTLAEVAKRHGHTLSGRDTRDTHSDEMVSAWSLSKLNDPLRSQSAGYTKDFFRYVKHRDEIPNSCYEMFAYAYLTKLTDLDREQGWQLEDRGDFTVRTKVFLESVKRLDGSRAKVGDRKKTYEVVADNKCFSFDIEKVPAYATAMRGLREGTASLLDYKHLPTHHHNNFNNNNSNFNNNFNNNNNVVFDETDLADNLFQQYQRPASAQPHTSDLDASVSHNSRHRSKPSPQNSNSQSAFRPKTPANQVVATNGGSPHDTSAVRDTRGQDTSVSRPGTTATTSNGGNFTFDDFANMDFSAQNAAGDVAAAAPLNFNNSSGDNGNFNNHKSPHNNHKNNHNNEKIHISKEQKQKKKQQQSQQS